MCKRSEKEMDDFHWQNPCVLFAYLGIKNVVYKPVKQKEPPPHSSRYMPLNKSFVPQITTAVPCRKKFTKLPYLRHYLSLSNYKP